MPAMKLFFLIPNQIFNLLRSKFHTQTLDPPSAASSCSGVTISTVHSAFEGVNYLEQGACLNDLSTSHSQYREYSWCSIKALNTRVSVFFTVFFSFSSSLSAVLCFFFVPITGTAFQKQDTQNWTLRVWSEISPIKQTFITSTGNSVWMKNYFCWIFALIFGKNRNS